MCLQHSLTRTEMQPRHAFPSYPRTDTSPLRLPVGWACLPDLVSCLSCASMPNRKDYFARRRQGTAHLDRMNRILQDYWRGSVPRTAWMNAAFLLSRRHNGYRVYPACRKVDVRSADQPLSGVEGYSVMLSCCILPEIVITR